MNKKDIQKYCYSVRIKDITLALMNFISKYDAYFQVNKTNPETNKVISWVIESYISQINELMVLNGDYEQHKEVYNDLNYLIDFINNLGENISLNLLNDKIREISIKSMTLIAKLSDDLNL
ncbi:MAG: hypothetical protein ACTSPY_15335 [Candidatus Helarchaeota archaeon]